MNKICKRIFIIFVLILLMLNYSFSATKKTKSTNPTTTEFKGFNGSPRMEIIVNDKKFDDVKIKIEDYSGLNASKISFYTYRNGAKGSLITDKNFIKKIEPTYTSDKKTIFRYTYTISNKYLNYKKHELYVEIADKNNSRCVLNTSFRIKRDGKKYNTDYAPRVFDWKRQGNNVSFTAKDWGGIKYVKLYDLNAKNPNKVAFEKSNLAKGASTVTFSLNLFKTKNGKYNIKVVTQDSNKDYPQTAIRGESFGLYSCPKELPRKLVMQITAIDHSPKNVGKSGDAVMVKSDNEYLLMDTYSNGSQAIIDNYLDNHKIKKFSIYISHRHPDHYGNALHLIDKYKISKIYLPNLADVTLNRIRDTAKKKGIEIVYLKQGSTFKIGQCTAKVIYFGGRYSNDINNESLVTMIETPQHVKYLTAGDAEEMVEKAILKKKIDISADIYKCSHHGIRVGNDRSNTHDFINKVKPSYFFYNYSYYVTNEKGENIKRREEKYGYGQKQRKFTSITETVKDLEKISNGYSVSYNGQIDFYIYNTKEIIPKATKHTEKYTIKNVKNSNGTILPPVTYDLCNDSTHIETDKMKKAIKNKFSD